MSTPVIAPVALALLLGSCSFKKEVPTETRQALYRYYQPILELRAYSIRGVSTGRYNGQMEMKILTNDGVGDRLRDMELAAAQSIIGSLCLKPDDALWTSRPPNGIAPETGFYIEVYDSKGPVRGVYCSK